MSAKRWPSTSYSDRARGVVAFTLTDDGDGEAAGSPPAGGSGLCLCSCLSAAIAYGGSAASVAAAKGELWHAVRPKRKTASAAGSPRRPGPKTRPLQTAKIRRYIQVTAVGGTGAQLSWHSELQTQLEYAMPQSVVDSGLTPVSHPPASLTWQEVVTVVGLTTMG